MKISWMTTFLAALLLGATPVLMVGCGEEETDAEAVVDDAEDVVEDGVDAAEGAAEEGADALEGVTD